MNNTVQITEGVMSVRKLNGIQMGQLSSCEYLIDQNNFPHIFGYIVFKEIVNNAVNNSLYDIEIDRETRMVFRECTIDGAFECNKEIRFIAKAVLLEKLRE